MGVDWSPLARSSVATEELDGELVLYDPDNRRLLVLNPTGSAVWKGCDGTVPVPRLIERLAAAAGQEPAEIADDVVAFVEHLRHAGLLDEGPGPTGGQGPPPDRPGTAAPRR